MGLDEAIKIAEDAFYSLPLFLLLFYIKNRFIILSFCDHLDILRGMSPLLRSGIIPCAIFNSEFSCVVNQDFEIFPSLLIYRGFYCSILIAQLEDSAIFLNAYFFQTFFNLTPLRTSIMTKTFS